MDEPDFPMTPATRRGPSRRTLFTAGSAAGLALLLGFGGAKVADAQQAPIPWWTDDDGITKVIRPGPSFDVVAENRLDERIVSSPAISDGAIYFRTAGHLVRIASACAPPE